MFICQIALKVQGKALDHEIQVTVANFYCDFKGLVIQTHHTTLSFSSNSVHNVRYNHWTLNIDHSDTLLF